MSDRTRTPMDARTSPFASVRHGTLDVGLRERAQQDGRPIVRSEAMDQPVQATRMPPPSR